MSEKYTLYTRSNFDGIICAALLKEIGLVGEVKFVHPKDIQDGKIELTNRDITASLPYSPDVYMAFDNHSSEYIRTQTVKDNYIIELAAPSCAGIIYDYYGGKNKFSSNLNNLIEAVDRANCVNFEQDDIINPKGWVLLNFLMDPRTGLGRFRNFTISNYNLMLKLVDLCPQKTIDEIMLDSDVKERIELYKSEQEKSIEQIKKCTKTDGSIAVIDLRQEEIIHAGNRFMVYALFPECNVSIHEFFGKQNQNTVLAVGKSIINKTCPVDLGAIMFEFGGGGHMNAATCQIDNDTADDVLKDVISRIKLQEEEFNKE